MSVAKEERGALGNIRIRIPRRYRDHADPKALSENPTIKNVFDSRLLPFLNHPCVDKGEGKVFRIGEKPG